MKKRALWLHLWEWVTNLSFGLTSGPFPFATIQPNLLQTLTIPREV